jgi:integrase
MVLLLDSCSALDDYAPMMRALLTFTLMRPGELFALDWEDIDLKAGRVRAGERGWILDGRCRRRTSIRCAGCSMPSTAETSTLRRNCCTKR